MADSLSVAINPYRLLTWDPLNVKNPVSGGMPAGKLGVSSEYITSGDDNPVSVEVKYPLDSVSYIKGAYNGRSTADDGSADGNGRPTGINWSYQDFSLEATYARRFFNALWLGATARHYVQNFNNGYNNSPSRSYNSVDIAAREEWLKNDYFTAGLLDWGNRLSGDGCNSDRIPTSLLAGWRHWFLKDDFRSIKTDANLTCGLNGEGITQFNIGGEGTLKRGEYDFLIRLGACYNGQLHPLVGFGVGKEFGGIKASVYSAIWVSPELTPELKLSGTVDFGMPKKKTAAQSSGEPH
jgi:hypothetical protein